MHECPRPPAGTGRHTVRAESLPVRATTIVLGYLLQSYLTWCYLVLVTSVIVEIDYY